MIKFEKFTLNNGLKVIVHNDPSTSNVAFNILYNVGARDENPRKTGFAHLFEHLMFEGSINIPSYDKPLQMAGGENNAFTNNDITNYYITILKENLETAFQNKIKANVEEYPRLIKTAAEEDNKAALNAFK